jgi:hypothetical protein
VEIDKRFKKALTDKEFNLVSKVDKYGNKVNKQDNAMKNFYQITSNDKKKDKGTSKNDHLDQKGK